MRLSDAAGILRIPPNAKRYAILLSSVGAVAWHLFIGSRDGGANGVVIASTPEYILLSARDIGTAIQGEITFRNNAGTQVNVGYIDISLAE